MKIYVGSDHGGVNLTKSLIKYLEDKSYEYQHISFEGESVDYPIIAKKVCYFVKENNENFGILICKTGIGMSIASNRVSNIRSALVTNEFLSLMSRKHNNANVICFGENVINVEDAKKCVDIFLNASFELGRHERRVKLLENM